MSTKFKVFYHEYFAKIPNFIGTQINDDDIMGCSQLLKGKLTWSKSIENSPFLQFKFIS